MRRFIDEWRRARAPDDWCWGCDTIRNRCEMAWTGDGSAWLCARCRGLICPHGHNLDDGCARCVKRNYYDQTIATLRSTMPQMAP